MTPFHSKYSDDNWKDVIPIVPPGYEKSKHNIIFDQHSHTNYSDGSLTIKQNIEWHIAMGYNALAITDHNNMRHLEKVKDIKKQYFQKGILILSGIEYTTIRFHFNFLGISKWNERIPYKPKDEKIIKCINKVHDEGGIVICNHIPWSLYEEKYKNHPSREKLIEWGVDFIEIVNDDCKPENVYDQESYDFCIHHNGEIGMITGTDMHSPNRLASGGVHGWTLLNLKELTEEALLEQLRNKNTEIIYSKTPYRDMGLRKKSI
ncbi:MAG: PHP domain-containing protein [Candidatus Thorarchaeota archaeon]